MGEDELQERSGGRGAGTILKLHEVTEPERVYYEQAGKLRDAKLRYAQAFQIAKARGGSDELAKQVAIEMTGAELIMFEAALRIAEERLS